MTIQNVIDRVDRLRPNYMDRDLKVAYLQDLDQMVYNEVLLKHKHEAAEEVPPDYSGDRTGETKLLVPEPYTEMYIHWLCAKIDLMNQEIDKYNNDTALFQTAYGTMCDWWNRTKMPIGALPHFKI